MADINLLPWREARRQRQRQYFLIGSVATVVAAVLAVWIWGSVVKAQISDQTMRNEYLSTHIRMLDQELSEIRDLQRKRNQLIERMRVIQSLQGHRPVIVRLMDQFCLLYTSDAADE